ncbi:MAG: outer membrane receptor protein involved in Fe transport, partial [Myxococcota bacterium]
DTILAPGASLRLRKNIAFDDELQWSVRPAVSVDYRYEKFSPENTAPGAKVGRESDRHSVSFGGELSTLLGPIGTELIGSGRWERVWSTLENPGSVTGTVITPTDQKADDEFTWRVGLVQRSIPSTELTFNYAASVRFPSLYELFGNTGNVVGNPRLAAEEGTTMDAGIVHSADWLPDGNTWNLQLHIFQTKMTNLIQFAQNSQGVARAENVDSVELLGIEIGTYADVLSHLRVRGSMSWMETENTGEIKARKGKQLARRPRWQTFARLEGYHDFGRKSVGEVGLWVDVEHITGNFQDNANLVELPERTLMGVGAYAEFWDSQLRVDVTVRNLTDSRVQDFSGFPLPGVSALASLRYVPKL